MGYHQLSFLMGVHAQAIAISLCSRLLGRYRAPPLALDNLLYHIANCFMLFNNCLCETTRLTVIGDRFGHCKTIPICHFAFECSVESSLLSTS